MIAPWDQRPAELANLLNPAFCSILLRESIIGHWEYARTDMPYALSSLVLPLVLHKPTRDVLPTTVATKFHSWVHSNESVRIGFQARARHLIPFFQEALFFGTQGGLLSFSNGGELHAPRLRLRNLQWPQESEPQVCRQKARFLGRWFTRAGDSATIFAILGIKL
jgi:hypothetical protein